MKNKLSLLIYGIFFISFFCGVIAFAQDPEISLKFDAVSQLNEGMKIDYRMAFICEKYCMKPDIYYEEEEPIMPWE